METDITDGGGLRDGFSFICFNYLVFEYGGDE